MASVIGRRYIPSLAVTDTGYVYAAAGGFTVVASPSGALDHTQGTDQGLDTGGLSAVTAAETKTAYTHSQVAHAPSTAQANADITKAEIEAKLTGALTSHSHAAGAATSLDTTSDVIIDLATKGLVLKDTQGTPHYWRVTIDTTGALTTTDIGTSKP
jgi:hypothetical protein